MTAHLAGKEDVLVRAAPLIKETGDWRRFLRGQEAEDILRALRRARRPMKAHRKCYTGSQTPENPGMGDGK